MEDSNEVQELLSRSYSTPDYIDDADFEAGNLTKKRDYKALFNIRVRRTGNAGNGVVRVGG